MNILALKENEVMISPDTVAAIIRLENQAKRVAEEQKAFRQALLEEMEEKGIRKVEVPGLTITYVDATDREQFDKKAFRSDNPDLYDQYITFAPVKSSVRVKVGE